MSTVDARAVGRGALAGLLLIVPLSALRVVIDQTRSTTSTTAAGCRCSRSRCSSPTSSPGVVAGRRAPDAPLSNGILAGVGAFLLWIPLRVLIWVGRGESQGLFSGSDPVFTAGQLFGQLLFAAVFGLIGGIDRRAPGAGDADRSNVPLER